MPTIDDIEDTVLNETNCSRKCLDSTCTSYLEQFHREQKIEEILLRARGNREPVGGRVKTLWKWTRMTEVPAAIYT